MTANHRGASPIEPHVSRFYRSGTLWYLGVTLAIAGTIAFFAYSKTTVTITLAPETITETTVLALNARPEAVNQEDEIHGALLSATAEGRQSVKVPTAGATVDDYARGTVTIVNTWSQAQPLAATTRLKASSNGLIYRTTKRVDVPSGGRVNVEVAADEAGEKGNVGPDHFEIVALWPGLKDKIYGESSQAMTGGTRSSATLAQATIDRAITDLQDELMKKITSSPPLPPKGMELVGQSSLQATNITASQKAGDEVASFTVQGTVGMVFPALSHDELQNVVTKALHRALPDTKEFVGNEPTISWRILKKSVPEQRANLELTASHTARLRTDAHMLQASAFITKSREDIVSALRNTPGISTVAVKISPLWASRAPSLPQHIQVVINYH